MLYGRCLGFVLSLISLPALLSNAMARAQDSPAKAQQSVVEAARQAREQTKNRKPAKVITDDDMDRNPARPGEAVSVVGSEPKPGTQPPQTLPPAAAGKRQAAKLTEEIAGLKDRIASAQKDLDLLQRQLVLDSEAFYSQTGFASDASGQAKLDNEKQQITDKQKELDDLKNHLTALEQQVKPSAAGPPPAENKPAKPTTSAPPAPATPSPR